MYTFMISELWWDTAYQTDFLPVFAKYSHNSDNQDASEILSDGTSVLHACATQMLKTKHIISIKLKICHCVQVAVSDIMSFIYWER